MLMPRWALGTVVIAPLGALFGQGTFANAVDLARGTFLVFVLLMSTWLVFGFRRDRPAL